MYSIRWSRVQSVDASSWVWCLFAKPSLNVRFKYVYRSDDVVSGRAHTSPNWTPFGPNTDHMVCIITILSSFLHLGPRAEIVSYL